MIPRHPVPEKGFPAGIPLTGCIAALFPGACTGGKVDISEELELVFGLKTHGCPFNYKAFHGVKINP
jgi:hypothetical protein